MSSHNYRFKRAWRTTTRQAVLAKTGGRCIFCGYPGTDGKGKGLHLAHMISDERGGPATEDNLVPACASCHKSYDRKPRRLGLSPSDRSAPTSTPRSPRVDFSSSERTAPSLTATRTAANLRLLVPVDLLSSAVAADSAGIDPASADVEGQFREGV